MTAYADSTAYRLVYDTSATNDRLSAYLEKASRKIDAALASRGRSVPRIRSEELSAALSDVCIDMVHRVLGASGDAEIGIPDGVTSYSQTQGGFQESFAWAQPYTDMRIRDDELDMLLLMLGADTSGYGLARFGGDSE
jgi:hypothetical protein